MIPPAPNRASAQSIGRSVSARGCLRLIKIGELSFLLLGTCMPKSGSRNSRAETSQLTCFHAFSALFGVDGFRNLAYFQSLAHSCAKTWGVGGLYYRRCASALILSWSPAMPEVPPPSLTVLEVISPNSSRSAINVVSTPFLIGRGTEGNNLPLDDPRISRQCAALLSEGGRYFPQGPRPSRRPLR